jgi:hypothetical protein
MRHNAPRTGSNARQRLAKRQEGADTRGNVEQESTTRHKHHEGRSNCRTTVNTSAAKHHTARQRAATTPSKGHQSATTYRNAQQGAKQRSKAPVRRSKRAVTGRQRYSVQSRPSNTRRQLVETYATVTNGGDAARSTVTHRQQSDTQMTLRVGIRESGPANSSQKLSRPGFGPAA